MMEKRKTILVVDDVPDEIVILEEILKRDYQVKAVTSGEAALKIVGSEAPDLILLDIIMPDMDGFEVCRRLKQDVAGATIPVIFLTARVKSADESMGFQVGAVDYIRKPVDPDIVKKRIAAHLEMKDEALRSSEVRYRRLFETTKSGIMIVDAATRKIIDVNPAFVEMLGCTQESFLGASLGDFEFLKGIVGAKDGPPAPLTGEYVRHKDGPLETPDGRSIFVQSMLNSYEVDHREVLQLSIWEISALVAAERERDEFAAKLSHYLSTSPTVTYAIRIKDGKAPMEWVSENIRELLGYSVAEALDPDWWLRNVHASDRMRALGGISKLTHNSSFSHEYRFNRKDRSIVWLRDEMRFVQSKGGEAEIVGTLTDISERKKVESELSLKSQALEATANAIVITDRDGNIRWINPAFETLTGYSRAEVLDRNPRILNSGEQDLGFYRSFWETILSGKSWKGELVNRRKGGEHYTEEMTITPVLDESRSISGFIAVMSDVTERKLARERLEASLNEKEVLLREIHHRTNNNIQLMISLLSLSSQKITDLALRDLIEGVCLRLVSMALIHEQFYNSTDMARIDFALYLHQLVNGLTGDFKKTSGEISIAPVVEPVLLSLEKAIPAGLTAAELIINALRHAYPEDSPPGHIRILLRRVGAAVELTVRDDGVGLPEAFAADKANSLGMILVHTLAEQLQGKIEFRSREGTEAILRFPIA
jgi:PAS domain S-box-containing protein